MARLAWLLAAVACLSFPAAADAQMRKTCRPVGGDKVVCSEPPGAAAERQKREAEAARQAEDAAAAQAARDQEAVRAWRKAVSTAVLAGRCEEAKRIALENGDLDGADLAMRLCVPRP
jgi:hypothetical protein